MPIDFRLLIQLTIKSPAALKNYAVKHELEVFAVSETWLRSDNKFSADKVCSTGYCFIMFHGYAHEVEEQVFCWKNASKWTSKLILDPTLSDHSAEHCKLHLNNHIWKELNQWLS